jgi:hypothetical protein
LPSIIVIVDTPTEIVDHDKRPPSREDAVHSRSLRVAVSFQPTLTIVAAVAEAEPWIRPDRAGAIALP